jgi:hypothetical protein
MAAYLVTLGDSVHWGQGLLHAHKLHTIVGAEMRKTQPDLVDHFLAHSGATIGVGATVKRQRVHGEVPIAYPTILEQVEGFVGAPADVTAVLVNGGINDIDIRNILNPAVSPRTLSDLTVEHCYDSMRVVLEAVVHGFDNPATAVVVTPYYPILSPRSQPFGIPRLLAHQGLAVPRELDLTIGTNPLVARCLQFWNESTVCLKRAIAEVNAAMAIPRIAFADPGFTENNAVFAGEPWLFGLGRDLTLPPQDEVIGERHHACDLAFPPIDWPTREQCYRASAGHPNVTGARKYADAILTALGLNP